MCLQYIIICIQKILIANRGEIAVRAIRACQEMGIKTVAIYSDVDKDAMHTKIADEAICVGPSSAPLSYSNKQNIISAALVTNADAIFPGYGFLSEDGSFAEVVEKAGLKFIGPKYQHIFMMGDKIEAKETAKRLGIPLVPGSEGEITSVEDAKRIAKDLGYPVVIKAAAGGGGKGIRMVNSEADIEEAFMQAKQEAQNFANDCLYLEKCVINPRHIEVQILGDTHGNVVHLYERECSIQRNNQKVIEESPSPAISKEEREYICNLTAEAMRKLGYISVGTVEYLYADGQFYFMEMNTRIQVEHTVTEEVTGVDLVYEMIRVANGKPLSFTQEDIRLNGHAFEFRIIAEDPKTFMPCPGKISYFHPPAGLGVRLDAAIYSGYTILPYYDSMIAKLVVHGVNREHTINRAKRALNEFIVEGIQTSIPLHLGLLNNRSFCESDFHIKWLQETYLPSLEPALKKDDKKD